ncbi:hypothetical protein EST38_g5580 [Candolleomyces aberdarensis]|uniref:Cupredoxin n=1 Tax=Candolleomyces aberdarensis TaxID=2316362 RepID=A0A4Q2DK67_9AGAR|nr:hypothetical protein EST38_g5580 [Candolleomyces aberdarensis]
MYSSTVALALAALAPSAFGAILDVNVGPGGQFVYDPPYVHAVYGDIVRFHFNPKNHTVTQSAFDPPCVGLEGGFRTGFIPVPAGTNPLPVQEFNVPDNAGAPIWFYCGQTAHCGQGMVFAVNPPADGDHSFEAFRNLAIARNGTAATGSATPPASTSTAADAYTTPPPPKWEHATKTVTWGGQTYATTYTSYEGTPEPTPAVTPQDHKIIVGADGQLAYTPANIQAAINDTVTFEFRPKNHTVTQSSFSNPCIGLRKEDGTEGFKSGFTPVAADATTFPTFTIKINDTAPIWGYCGQVNHCQSGMVFAINAVESGPNNFNAFRQLAMRPQNTSSQTNGGSNNGGSNGNNNSGNGNNNSAAVAVGPAAALTVLAGAFTLFAAFL